MEQPNIDYVKTIIRSVLTSSPHKVTVSQVLLDYTELEGEDIPFRQLGFNTVYDLLQDMNDILEIPSRPNMFSSIKLIVDAKTSHLRKLVMNQKVTKKKRIKKNIHTSDKRNSHSKTKNVSVKNYGGPNINDNARRYVKNVKNTHVYNSSPRGYDYIEKNSVNSSNCKGIVTNDLQKYIENLCALSQSPLKLCLLKNHLIYHPDYDKLQSSNIEDSINMLKYFIYIDKGGVHLRNSPFEIFPATRSDTKNDIKPVSSDIILPSVVDVNDELKISNNNLIYDFMYDDEGNSVHESNSPFEIFPATRSDTKNDIKPVSSDIILPSVVDVNDELKISNNNLIYDFMYDDEGNSVHESNSPFEIFPATRSDTKNDIKPVSSDIILPSVVDVNDELKISNNNLIYDFMYDDEGNSVHESNSPFEIFPATRSDTKNDIKPVSSDIILPSVVDVNDELKISNNNLIYDFMYDDEGNSVHESNSPFEIFPATRSDTKNDIKPVSSDIILPSVVDVNDELKISNNNLIYDFMYDDEGNSVHESNSPFEIFPATRSDTKNDIKPVSSDIILPSVVDVNDELKISNNNLIYDFMYDDEGNSVHESNSPFEIFPATRSDTKNDIKPVSSDIILPSVVDENDELKISNNNLIYDFMYDDEGNSIHESNSPFEIFPATRSDTKNDIKPVSSDIILPSVVDVNDELKISNNNLIYDFMYDDEGNSVHESNSPFEIFPATRSDTKNDIKPVSSDIILPSVVDVNDELKISNNNLIYDFMYDDEGNSVHESSLNEIHVKHSDANICENENNKLSKASTVFNVIHPCDKDLTKKKKGKRNTNIQAKNKNNSKTSKILTTKKPCRNIGSNKKLEAKPVIPVNLKKDDFKNMIVSIIKENEEPITVKEVLTNFNEKYGYDFPFQTFSCRTCMDYFRLYSTIYKLENQFSTNSIISLKEQVLFNPTTIMRRLLSESSIFKNDNLDEPRLVQDLSEFNDNHHDNDDNYSNQDFDEPIEETQCKQSIYDYKQFDSGMILDSMKEKMRCVLNMYPNGILYNEFMDIYEREYQSYFTFSEYGFKGMKDMAYNLPSVFYVKTTEDKDECILYNAERRSELQNNLIDPSLRYKNIPKTVLHNLSIFFDKHRNGISLDKVMARYCSKFGRSYEPLKYGYSSEKHMFVSLDKMVKIENNVLYTLDPYAYTYFIKNKDFIDMCDSTLRLVTNSLINYSGSDIPSLSFVYKTHEMEYNEIINVIVAEIYNPSLFYVHLASTVDSLKKLMINLQSFYTKNEHKYKLSPELLTVKLACAACFENTMQWHRAMIINLIDEHTVEVLYVDYGSIEKIEKSKIRALDLEFKSFPMFAIRCSLHYFDKYNYAYTRTMNDIFAAMVDHKILQAIFHEINSNDPEKNNVTLNVIGENINENLNNECVCQFNNLLIKKSEKSARLEISIMFENEENVDFDRIFDEWMKQINQCE